MKLLNKQAIKLDKMILFQRSGHEVELNAPMEVSWEEALLSSASNADVLK